jgi:D-glycerate 3-kinase
MKLAKDLFEALRDGKPAKIPQYDKSVYDGQGDRVAIGEWKEVNKTDEQKVQVIIFEGWSVGFRALDPADVERKQALAKLDNSALSKYRLEDLLFVNKKLREYDVMTDLLHAFIHIDAEETRFVYDWRLEQEAALRREKGSGMTDEQVIKFVDGYYPAYELFTQSLRSGIFGKAATAGKQLRLVVGRDRRVKQVYQI